MSTNIKIETRKVVYYIAVSVDGFIADTKGNTEAFSMTADYIPDYIRSLREYDTVLMGKNTYEAGYKFGIKPGEPSPMYSHMMQYVFSQTMEQYENEGLQVIRDDPARFVQGLKSQQGGAIYLCGGGNLAGCLLKASLIDELILKVNPLIFGKGIPLFSDYDVPLSLALLDTKVYQDGNVFLRYQLASS